MSIGKPSIEARILLSIFWGGVRSSNSINKPLNNFAPPVLCVKELSEKSHFIQKRFIGIEPGRI